MSRVLKGREMGTVRVVGECCCWRLSRGDPLPKFEEICCQARISLYVDDYVDFSKRAYTPVQL
jgi:hypothetical protein